MNTKLIIAGVVLILVILFGWYVFGVIEENGELTQANSTLTETNKNWERDYNKIKKVADISADAVAKSAATKNHLIIKTAELARDLEILKNENADIKKWSINVMPSLLAYKLLDLSGDKPKNGLYKPAEGTINADGRAEIEVQNEDLYKYADELKTAVRSCNADKTGLREWYQNVGIVLQ